jgi:hypothetical protein
MRRGCALFLSFIFLSLTTCSVSAEPPDGPSDVHRWLYHPPEGLPLDWYMKYAEKYTVVRVKDIWFNWSGESRLAGRIVLTITPLPQHDSYGVPHIGRQTRRFLVNVLAYYDAGNYYASRPSVRYTHSLTLSTQSYWIDEVKLKMDASQYYDPYGNNWDISVKWIGASHAYWSGRWVMNGHVEGSTFEERMRDKAEKSQFVTENAYIVKDSYLAWLRWRDAYVKRWVDDRNTANMVSLAMSGAGLGLGVMALVFPPIGLPLSLVSCGLGYLSLIYSMCNSISYDDVKSLMEKSTEWSNGDNTKPDKLVARGVWHFPKPLKKSDVEDRRDCTDDAYPDFFWHYKRWVVATHITAVVDVGVWNWGIGEGNRLTLPITAEVSLNPGPYEADDGFKRVETVTAELRLRRNTTERFGLPRPHASAFPDYDPNVSYAFTFSVPSSPFDGDVNYVIHWGDGHITEVKDVPEHMAVTREHAWEREGTYTMEVYAYGYRDGTLHLSPVLEKTVVVDAGSGDGGAGGSPIPPGQPIAPPTPVSAWPTGENPS